jgi:hypothetical protein
MRSKPQKANLKPEPETSTLPVVQAQQPQAVPAETLAQLDADIAALAAEARELTDDVRVGDDLKFKKGRWVKVIGDEEIKISATATFVVDTKSYRRGWIRWIDRKPTFKLIGRPIDGFVSPMRERLPDRDENRWPRDAKGVPQDPWQESFSIVMRDLGDTRLCTWTTTSWYGQKALGALLNIYVRDGKKHPDLMPVVLLASETKSTVSYGDVEAPVLRVVDWKPFGEGAAPPGMHNLPQPKLPVTQELLPPPKSINAELDDTIPF